MEKRIELERRGKEPSEVTDLNLDNARSTHIEGLTEEYTKLATLSMINVNLTSLKGFPKLPELKRLELSDNRISGGLNVLQGCPKLSHLNLSGNKIKDLEALEPLKTLENLTHLDLFNNPLGSEEEDYRNKIFKLLPSLKFLDGVDVNNVEDEDSEGEDGQNGTVEEEEDEGEDEGEEGEEDGEEENGAAEEAEDDDEGGGEDDEDEDDESDEEDEEDYGLGLAAIYNDNLEDDEDGEDFDGEGEDEDDDDLDEEDEESEEPQSKRAKTD